MSNEEILTKHLASLGLKMGGCNQKIERLSKLQLKKVISNITDSSSTDVDVKINRADYVVEVSNVDDEMDFGIITKSEYISRYGDERYDK